MPLFMVLLGVILLIFLISYFKLNTFVSLLIVSFVIALTLGIPLKSIVSTIETGMGSTLGHIAVIFGLGAMLGRLLADAGGAQRIAMTLIDKFGKKHIQWAVIIASFIVGIAMFFEVGLVLLLPIIFSIAKELDIKPINLGIPMLAALLVTHAFLPPHPGPTVIAASYHASLGLVLTYGIIAAIPTVIISGIFFTKIDRKIVPSAFAKDGNMAMIGDVSEIPLDQTPKFGISILTAMLPVIILMSSTIVSMIQEITGFHKNFIYQVIEFLGNADVAMLLSLLFAVYTMGIRRKISFKKIGSSCANAASAIGMMLLIIGGGGAFKQVLIDGGVGKYIATLFTGVSISPILLAWIIAAILRIALGSATVAAISTAGLVIPLLAATPGVNLALVTLATGAGSAICSHVNDASFWIIKEYFDFDMKETFLTWTLMSTVLSVVGLAMIMVMDIFV
ncbi:gluconate:H+ symporter [Agrilactobacillus yilanensis]|uniref:Gluconate:H+ symporter n=1 Tax=Agrilactobacillus yilanensis TaxID=2485997 RepID=A0ABW4J2S9_9LACO|nr:gluconate:H+ symporter [Agrilactobacillus yilanensis]